MALEPIFMGAVKYWIILTLTSIGLASVFAIVTGGLDFSRFTAYMGDLALLLSLIMILTGVSVGMSWVKRTQGDNEEEEGEITRVPDGRGSLYIARITRRRVINEEDNKNEGNEARADSMVRALTYVLCGAMMFTETVALAITVG